MSRPRVTIAAEGLLLRNGVITRRQLERAVTYQQAHGGLISQILIESGCVTEDRFASILTAHYAFPYLPLDHYEIDEYVLRLVPEHVARQHWLIPVHVVGNVLSMAMVDPSDTKTLEALELFTDCTVQTFVSTPSDIQRAIEQYYPRLRPLAERLDARAMRRPAAVPGDATEALQAPERRGTPRVARRLALALTHDQDTVHARTKNVSLGGLCCGLTGRFFPRMTKLELRLKLAETAASGLIECRGVIVRVIAGGAEKGQARYALGIAFSDLPDPGRAAITAHLRAPQGRPATDGLLTGRSRWTEGL